MKVDKDPDARLDYKWDWTSWLDASETINPFPTVTGTGGITIETPTVSPDGKSVIAWISGGTLGDTVEAVCHIVTSEGRQDDRTIVLNITSR